GKPEMVREGGGWTAIIAPTGQILAGPNRDKEAILHAELDLSMIANFKYVSDAAGHYARPDVLQLLVNFEPQSIMASQPRAAMPPSRESGFLFAASEPAALPNEAPVPRLPVPQE